MVRDGSYSVHERAVFLPVTVADKRAGHPRIRRGGSLATSVPANLGVTVAASALLAAGCGAPSTFVSLDNDYSASASAPLVVYEASWEAVSFQGPIPPGSTSGPQSTVPASDNTAYVVLAPGWNPAPPDAASVSSLVVDPNAFIILQSKNGFTVHLGDTLDIPVDDASFAGNCAAGSHITQADADFITQYVFPNTFGSLHYDAATCTTTPIAGDAGSE
jgi:hypothetical protein